jgi:ubiquinone/menaquinone biosynthesis C-methylase UbiE
MSKKHPVSTSWQPVNKWYNAAVGEQGHYYHQTIIIPYTLKLLNLKKDSTLLDLACGQGIFGRSIPSHISYVGLDIAPDLIRAARQYDKEPHHTYKVADITHPLPLQNALFTHAIIILALQNISDPKIVFQHIAQHLQPGGQCVIVLNHPCFRIPRQSSWQVDEANKTQYRRIDRYMSPMEIPIQAHPSQKQGSPQTWSFHFPLSTYTTYLYEAGFQIALIEEWCSNKVSTGKMAKMENRSRDEIPLFMALSAVKTKGLEPV